MTHTQTHTHGDRNHASNNPSQRDDHRRRGVARHDLSAVDDASSSRTGPASSPPASAKTSGLASAPRGSSQRLGRSRSYDVDATPLGGALIGRVPSASRTATPGPRRRLSSTPLHHLSAPRELAPVASSTPGLDSCGAIAPTTSGISAPICRRPLLLRAPSSLEGLAVAGDDPRVCVSRVDLAEPCETQLAKSWAALLEWDVGPQVRLRICPSRLECLFWWITAGSHPHSAERRRQRWTTGATTR